MKPFHLGVIALVAAAVVPLPSPAEPPPHAKAHGWRKKNDPNYIGYTGHKWQKDYGILEGKCNTAAVGAVLGGVVGGVVGSKAEGENRPVAIVLGTAIGAIIGAKVGQTIDQSDRACMGHALELAGEKRTVVWTNSATGVSYRLTPTRNYQDVNKPCRDFTTVVTKGDKKERVKGVACRTGNGTWEIKA